MSGAMFSLFLTVAVPYVSAQMRCPFARSSNDAYYVDGDWENPVYCASPPKCYHHSKYRAIDGSCNNLDHPDWGMAYTRYARLVPPKYADDISAPAIAVSGANLPSARLVSNTVFFEENNPDKEWTLVNMQWGQMVAHDMSLGGATIKSIRNNVRCCTDDGKYKRHQHPTCYPIPIPKNDPFNVNQHFNLECMNFVRSPTDHDVGCANSASYAEQISKVTALLDLSTTYGVSAATLRKLRSFQGGRMRVERRYGRDWLPAEPNNYDTCDIDHRNERCYLGGDIRVNQSPGLTMLSIINLREHNRLADGLRQINPHWNDERLFQEARRINIAQYQHITYYEWLPIMLGYEKAKNYGLIYDHPNNCYINDYDPSVCPSTLNENANAALRYFHSQIEGHLKLMYPGGSCSNRTLRLSDYFEKPSVLECGNTFDGIFYGMMGQPQQSTDFNYDPEIRDFWLRFGRPFGGDLRAIDVQRCRDHGLASYNDYRVFFGKPRATKWEDYSDTISARFQTLLKSVYECPDDVDMSVGASCEKHENDTLAGPLFNAIIGEQFFRVRAGDRYFYENGQDRRIRFTPAQLREIRKASISGLYCDNSHDSVRIQRRGFELVSKDNPLVKCSELPTIDLRAWRECPNIIDKIVRVLTN